MISERKICIKCNIEKNINEFEFRKDTQKYRNVCKHCRYLQKYEASIKRKNDNKEKIRKEVYQSKRDKINARRREAYKLKKEEINKKRREYYQQKKDEINAKRREKVKKIVEVKDIKTKIKKQLKRTLDKSFVRKGLKRQKGYEELLCCTIDEAVDYLLINYNKKYDKDLTVYDEVDIDHVLGLWSAYKQESIEELCCYKNLRLLSKRDNHNRRYRITNEDKKLICEYFDFLHEYKKK